MQVLDGVEELLIELGARDLERGAITDSAGALRLVYPNPSWTELLDLGVTEIRVYGADSPEIARRLRALLLNLADTVPDICRRRSRRQLTRLDAAVSGRPMLDPVELATRSAGRPAGDRWGRSRRMSGRLTSACGRRAP